MTADQVLEQCRELVALPLGAAALAVLEAKGDPKNEADALKGAQTIDFNLAGDPASAGLAGAHGLSARPRAASLT